MPGPASCQTIAASLAATLNSSQSGYPSVSVDSVHQKVTGADISFFYVGFPSVALVHTLDVSAGLVCANAANLLSNGQTITMNHVLGYSVEIARIDPASPASGSCVAVVTTLFGTGTFTATDAGILIASDSDVSAAFAGSSIVLTFAGAGNNLYARVICWGTIA